MRIVYTKHAVEKFEILKRLGWKITKIKVNKTIKNPTWKGTSRFGQETAMCLIDERHILRVIFDHDGDIIKVITFHPARRGTYETTL